MPIIAIAIMPTVMHITIIMLCYAYMYAPYDASSAYDAHYYAYYADYAKYYDYNYAHYYTY